MNIGIKNLIRVACVLVGGYMYAAQIRFDVAKFYRKYQSNLKYSNDGIEKWFNVGFPARCLSEENKEFINELGSVNKILSDPN